MPVVTREILVTYGSVAVGSVAAASGGNTAYTMEDTNGDGTVPGWIIAASEITFYSCTNAANNGTFTVVSVAGLVVTVNNASGVVEAASPGLAGFPVAGPSNFYMHERHRKNSDYKVRTYEFDVVITESVKATFDARTLSIERAFRSIRQRFRYLLDSSLRDDLNPVAESGGNTGFNQTSSIEKTGDSYDTGRSRKYHIRVEAQLPADHPGVSGRQDSTVEVRFEPSRRRVITISGRYTALGSNNSRAQYNASIATYAAAVQLAIGGTYELVSEVALADDQDKNLDFQRVYEEIIYNQASGETNNAAIVNGTYTYTRQQVAPGDSDSTARRLENVSVDFDCWVDRDQSLDPNNVWLTTVRPYILSQAKTAFNSNMAALIDAQVDVDRRQNRIHGRLLLQIVAEGGGNLIQVTKTIRVVSFHGKILTDTWDNDPLAKHVYDGPASCIRTQTTTELLLGGASGSGGGGGANGASVGAIFGGGVAAGGGRIQIGFANGFSQSIFGPNSGAAQSALVQAALSDDFAAGGGSQAPVAREGWIPISDTYTTTPIYLGLPGDQIELVEIVHEMVEAWANAPSGGGGGTPTPG